MSDQRVDDPRAVARLFIAALGHPVVDPWPGDERLSLSRWECPACRAGFGDPLWRPLLLRGDGRIACEANWCSIDAISLALHQLLRHDEPDRWRSIALEAQRLLHVLAAELHPVASVPLEAA